MQPITEHSNELTRNIDIASTPEMVKQLWAADKEMYSETTGLFSRQTMETIDKIVDVATLLLESGDNNMIVLSGCGTSGRIAFQSFKTFDRLLQQTGKQNLIKYLIAGADEALFESRELIEDNPHAGQHDLDTMTSGKSHVLYIGITCGLSAPYVAGQLDFCMEHLDRFVPVLLGFNPVDVARDVAIDCWDKTFLKVARRLEMLQSENKGFILNPVIGPEPITGSTRMKGGTATKILLHAILMTSLARHLHISMSVADQLSEFMKTSEAAYRDVTQLASIVNLAGNSLRSGGHIYYLSTDDRLALCGLIDASECKPTYGASREDVRAFIEGGYQRLNDNQVVQLSIQFEISRRHFESEIVTKLTSRDFLVLLAKDGEVTLSQATLDSSAVKVLINFVTSEQRVAMPTISSDQLSVLHTVQVSGGLVTSLGAHSVAIGDALMTSHLELACKLSCNVITTCGYILYGKVYQNFMIDLAVSNNKLFHRAINIIQRFGECCEADAREALLKCIYDCDSVTPAIVSNSISQHISHTVGKKQLVPTAILLVKLGCSRIKCRQILSKHPVIREALTNTAALEVDLN